MSHRDSVIKNNKELSKPMDLMNVGFVGVAGGGEKLVESAATTGSVGSQITVGDYKYNIFTGNGTWTPTGDGMMEYL